MAAQERWFEVSTPHFVVSTDLSHDGALTMARQLEEARAMLLAAAWPRAHDPRGRTRVIVFATPAEFDRYSGMHAAVAGVSLGRDGAEPTIAFSRGRANGVPRIAVHELAHDLSRWFLPLQPAWLAEGLAMYLENTRMDRSSGRAVMGEASEESLRWLKQNRFFMSAEGLFSTASPHSDDMQDVQSFYSGAWFLVNYLLNEQAEPFGRFQKRLHQLVPWRRAWHEAFDGMTTADLDRKMTAYAQAGGRFVVANVEVQAPVGEPKLRALSAAEAHGVKAVFASHAAPEVGEREAREALALDPNELRALSVQFRATDVAAVDARQQLAERAVAAHPESAEAWLLSALAARDAEARGSALARAAELDPELAGVALMRGELALQRGDAALALEQIRFAVRRSQLSPRAVASYVAALGETGRCSEAASVAESGDALFSSRCRVRGRSGEQLGCSAYVERAAHGDGALCAPAPARARASTERARTVPAQNARR